MERVLICGDRGWKDLDAIRRELKLIGVENIEVVIEGEARGADQLGKKAAILEGIPEDKILKFPAVWTEFGKAAGPIRNSQQLKEGKPTMCLAFHADIKSSKGTADMVKKCSLAGVSVKVIEK